MKRVFITGSNRGIGLELVRQCLARGDTVFAACREPSKASELKKLASQYSDTLSILKLEVTDPREIQAVGDELESKTDGLDLVINNAAVLLSGERLGNLDGKSLLNVLSINSVAPVMIAQRLSSLLKNGSDPKLINITSGLGSIERKRSGGRYSYDGSKAALNMFTRTLAFELRPSGIIAVVIHPGWVKTDMGGGGASLSVEKSAKGILQVAEDLTPSDAGRFLQWDGSELPW